ncbi:MAG: hypothetical protein MSH66_08425 [Bacteroidales bacterium]|nr:hypothetical protein [Bacteroidales bacterium]
MRIPIQILLSMLLSALPAAAQDVEAWTYPTDEPTEICSAGTGSADDPYQVTDAQQLANIAYLVNETEETFAGKCFILKNDIVLNSGVLAAAEGGAAGSLRQWTPIGSRANPDDDVHSFCGSFDGDGHTVSGLYIDNSSKGVDFLRYTGLFGAVGIGGLLHNIYICDAYIAETVCRAGILCGYAYTEGTAVTDCTVRDSKIKIFKTSAGGSSSAAYQSGYIGGIAGAIGGNGNIAFCTAENVVIEHADGHNAYIGGIAGAVAGDAGFCSARGRIVVGSDGITDDTSKRHAGGICAQAGGIVTDCLSAMDFTIQDNADVNAAGICFASGSAVMRCVNRGSFALTAPTAEETELSDVLASGICMGATAVSDCANYGSFTLTGYTSVADTPPSLAGIYLDYTGTEQAERFDRCLCVSPANRFPAGLTGVRIAPMIAAETNPEVTLCYYLFSDYTRQPTDLGIAAGTDYFKGALLLSDLNGKGEWAAAAADRLPEPLGFDALGGTLVLDELSAHQSSLLALCHGRTFPTVVWRRTMLLNSWNTLLAPFALSADELHAAFGSTGLYLEQLKAVRDEDAYVTLSFGNVLPSGTLQAGTPYLLWVSETAKALSRYTFTDKTIQAGIAPVRVSTPDDYVIEMTGCYDRADLPTFSYYIQNDKFWFISDSPAVTSKGYRCYFTAAEELSLTRALVRHGDDTTTALPAPLTPVRAALTPAPRYALDGRRAAAHTRGIVIAGGKKIWIK